MQLCLDDTRPLSLNLEPTGDIFVHEIIVVCDLPSIVVTIVVRNRSLKI